MPGFSFTGEMPAANNRYAITEQTSTGFKVAELNTTTLLTYENCCLTGFANGEYWAPHGVVYMNNHTITLVADWAASATNELYGVWSTTQGYVRVTKTASGYATSPASGDSAFGTLSISGTTVTSVITAGTSTATLSGQSITWDSGPLNVQTWTASWVVSGYFLYSSPTWPYPRLNVKGSSLVSDRATGTSSDGAAVGTQVVT